MKHFKDKTRVLERITERVTVFDATRSQRSNGLAEATHDPPLSRLARLREAPASIRRVRLMGRGAGWREAERDNCGDVFAVLQLARSAHQARSSFRTESIISKAVPLAPVASFVAPRRTGRCFIASRRF